MAYAELARDHGWADTLLEQIRGPHATFFHGREIAALPNSTLRRPALRLLYRNCPHRSVSHE
jgi:hypothetical protein